MLVRGRTVGLAVLVALGVGVWFALRRAVDVSSAEPPESEFRDALVSGGELSRQPMEPSRAEQPTAEQANPSEIRPARTSSAGRLQVEVRSVEKDLPIAGLRLALMPKELDGSFSMVPIETARAAFGEMPVTDERGHAEFTVASGIELVLRPYDQTVEAASLDIAAFASSESRSLTMRLHHDSDFVFHGRVVDAQTGEAISDAQVYLEKRGDFPPRDGKRAIPIGADGRFELESRSWQPCIYSVRTSEFPRVDFRASRAHDSVATELVIELPHTASLAVTVRRGDRTLVAGARIHLQSSDEVQMTTAETWIESGEWNGWAGPDGRCQIDFLPPGVDLHMQVVAEGATSCDAPTPLALLPGEQRSIDFVLSGAGAITGKLLDPRGAAVARREVCLEEADTHVRKLLDSAGEVTRTTDENGNFRFDDVPAGQWWVGTAGPAASLEGSGESVGLAEWVEVVDGPVDVTLQLEAARSIAGRVVAPDGTAAPLARVRADIADFAIAEKFATCDVDGRFVVTGLTNARWRLRADGAKDWVGTDEPVVDAGAVDVVLHVERAARMTVRVVDESSGASIDDGLVGCTRHVEPPETSWREIWAKSSEFTGLPAGRYTFWASIPDGRFGATPEFEIQAGADLANVVVTVRKGSTLRLQNRSDAMGWFNVEWRGCSISAGSTPVGGDSTVVTPAEEIVVQFTWEGAPSQTKTLTPAVGALTEVTFDRKP